MINKLNIEKIFDYLDNTSVVFYEKKKMPYLEGLNESINFLLDDEFEEEYEDDLVLEIVKHKDEIRALPFQPEEVRKAVQLCLLRGYKHANLTNSLITPDTIGIFISYLVKKLYKNKEITSILDPLVGTGNLLYTVINNLEVEVKAFGVENDHLKCKLSRNLGDMMDIENEIFFQDTLTYYDYGFNLILTDIDKEYNEDGYFPYKVINHHFDALADGGYFISIIDNDFFEQDKNQVFKEEIIKRGQIFGLIKLSDTLFKGTPKSILIIRKNDDKTKTIEDFLLVDLPSFNDLEEFNRIINQIDKWMLDREEDL